MLKTLYAIFFKCSVQPPLVDRHLHSNFGILQIKIMELQMRENRDFIVPVNILT